VTTQEPRDRQPAPFDDSEMRDRLKPVLRTRGDEPTTGRQKRREQSLIEPNDTEREIFQNLNFQLCAFQKIFDRRIDVVQGGLPRAVPCDDDYVPARRNLRQMLSHHFAHQPFGAIPRDGVTDLFARDKSKSTLLGSVCARPQNHQRV
jgi:hypothetical protein